MKYGHLLNVIQQMPLAILPAKWAEIRAFLEAKADGAMFSQEEIEAATGGKRQQPEETQMFGSVAVIPVVGVLSQKMNMMGDISRPGGTSTQLVSQQLRAALADPAVTSIALSIDSPGGGVFGIPELAAEIFAARAQKPIAAVIDPMAASAALWLGSQAAEVTITPSGTAGSIGVFSVHEDLSEMRAKMGIKTTLISAGKYKTEGNSFEPLSEDALAYRKAQVEDLNDQFVRAVATGRGVTPKFVRDNMGDGRMLFAKDAVKSGMVDRIGTLEQTLQRMNAKAGSRGKMAAQITNIREFEEHLRDVGFPQQAAKALAAGGWKALEGHQRDVETGEVDETAASAVQAWLNEQRLLRELRKTWN